jgi:hypothetical protein
MQILLKFYVKRKSSRDKQVLFWSCILDAEISESEVNFDYLNRGNIYPIDKMDDFELCINYSQVSIEIIRLDYDGYKKRPIFFLATDKTWLTGSPYSHSSSNVETYYIDTTKFIQELRNQLNINNDYETNKLQIQVIETIRKHIGIDILKNESVAGALSIYRRLLSFHVGGNFNAERGDRYIAIRTLDNDVKFDDAFVNVDILDNKKILYNIFCKFENNFKYELPTIESLEQFSQFRVTIINSENKKHQKIYEETFHLIRSFSVGMLIGGGYSKIVRNRFLPNKPLDKVPLDDHLTNISKKRHKDFFDYEHDYHMQLHGMKKEDLDSKYFSNERNGRELFLKFIRIVFSTAKTVIVIDAYFDNAALNDILVCSSNRFDLTIITTDPKRKRENSKNLVKNIYSAFPEGKVFFTERIHDRYVYINNGENEKLYSLSNSWNGLVNHYNLYVQEVPHEISLQIYEEIQKCVKDCNLQTKPKKAKKRQRKTVSKYKYTKAYINKIVQAIQIMPHDVNADIFIEAASEYYMAYYFRNIDKKTINSIILTLIQRFEQDSIDRIIEIICRKMLEKQKKVFEEELEFIDGKPFAWYDTPQKCYRRLSYGAFHGGTRSYSYRIDYGLSELLNLFFKEYPSKVIAMLQKQEHIICQNPAFINEEDGSNVYHVSEYIIFSFLYEFFPVDGVLTDDTKCFINKCREYTYIRIFFANILADKVLDTNGRDQAFEILIDELTFIELNSEEFAIILGSIYNRMSLQRKGDDSQETIRNRIVTYILDNVSGNAISIFAYYAYICSYDIKLGPFNEFCQDLRSHHKNDEKEILQKLLLLDSVRTNTSLQTKISKIIGVDISLLNNIFQDGDEELLEKEIVESDIRKYIPLVPYLSGILAECVNIDEENGFDNITNSLNIDKNLIFNIKYLSEITMFYYDFYLLLSTIMNIPEDNAGKTKLLELARWYFPVCLKNMPNDFYGLAMKIVGIYSIVIDDGQRKALLNRIDYLPSKALIQCSINSQVLEYLSVYDEFVENADVDGYHKTIVVENLLTIGLVLCMRSLEDDNNELKDELLRVISKINEKINHILTKTLKPILAYGMKYAKEPIAENKNAFIDAMKYKFYPPQVYFILEGGNV